MFEVNNNNIRITPWRHFVAFIVNFERISHIFLVFLMLILNK